MRRLQPPNGRSAAVAAFLLACCTIAWPVCGQAESRPATPASKPAPEPPPYNAPDCPLALDLTIIDGHVPREWDEPSELKDQTSRTIRMGEPVSLRLRFTNVSKERLSIYRPDTSRGSVGIRIIGPDGRALRYNRPQVGKGFTPLDAVTLDPGQELYLETTLFSNREVGSAHRYIFDQPGQWTIDAVHSRGISAPVNVRSKPVFLTVGPPLDHWQELWSAGLPGLVDNTEPSFVKREESRAGIRAILGPGPSCFDPWITTPPKPFDALVIRPDDPSPEGQARRLAGSYLRALDECKPDEFEPLIADDCSFNKNRDKAALLRELRANVGAMDPAKLMLIVEKSEFKTIQEDRVIARLQVLAHDESSGRDARSFYNIGFEPRAGVWKIVYLDIQRSVRN